MNDVDYDLNGNGNVSVGYDDINPVPVYSVDYVKHDSPHHLQVQYGT